MRIGTFRKLFVFVTLLWTTLSFSAEKKQASKPDIEVIGPYKFIVIGDSEVGKTALLTRFHDGTFYKYGATLGIDFKMSSIDLTADKKKYKMALQIWDTAGQEKFRTITQNYYRDSHGVIYVFDLTSQDSFDHIEQWVTDSCQFLKEGTPRLLVGNKVDLERMVSEQEAQALADKLGMVYIETSAKNDTNVSPAFATLARDTLKFHGPISKEKKKKKPKSSCMPCSRS